MLPQGVGEGRQEGLGSRQALTWNKKPRAASLLPVPWVCRTHSSALSFGSNLMGSGSINWEQHPGDNEQVSAQTQGLVLREDYFIIINILISYIVNYWQKLSALGNLQ